MSWIHFRLRKRRMPKGNLQTVSLWRQRQTQITGSFSTRAQTAISGTVKSHRGSTSMRTATRASPPARRTPVTLVTSKARVGRAMA